MTEKLFASLLVCDDLDLRSAALNMAIDEALLETATKPTIRFYRWSRPALSFGYFGKFSDIAEYQSERDIVRRWSGGGIVFHGEDLTYSLVIPASDSTFGQSSISIYESVHCALSRVLLEQGHDAIVAAVDDRRTGVSEAGYTSECFENPVRADVLLGAQKIAGAAQRRTRRGLLQQGSIGHVDLPEDFEMRFATQLSVEVTIQELNGALLERAREIAEEKYGSDAWVRRR